MLFYQQSSLLELSVYEGIQIEFWETKISEVWDKSVRCISSQITDLSPLIRAHLESLRALPARARSLRALPLVTTPSPGY